MKNNQLTHQQPIGNIRSLGELVPEGLEVSDHIADGTSVQNLTRVDQYKLIEKSNSFRRRLQKRNNFDRPIKSRNISGELNNVVGSCSLRYEN